MECYFGAHLLLRSADGQSCLLCHPLHGMNVTYALHQQRWTIKLIKRVLLLLLQAAAEEKLDRCSSATLSWPRDRIHVERQRWNGMSKNGRHLIRESGNQTNIIILPFFPDLFLLFFSSSSYHHHYSSSPAIVPVSSSVSGRTKLYCKCVLRIYTAL